MHLALLVVLSLPIFHCNALDLSTESYFKEFVPYELKVLREGISEDGEASTILIYLATLISVAQFDALAPYHPTSEGVLAKLRKRPYHERTLENKNKAAIYAGAKLLMTLVPSQESTVRQFFWKLNLDPDDNEENAKTPTGIGNMVAKLIFESCRNDGMNLNGGWDVGGNLRSANVLPFKDYTGYEPVNTINSLSKPERWQPGQTAFHPGIYSSQQFLTPQMRLVTPFTFEDITQFSLDPHARMPVEQINTFKSQAGEFDAYKKSVKELLFFASDLSEGQKAISEFFDDKIKSIFQSTLHIAHHKKLSPDEYSQLDLTTKLAVFDALIVVWQLKTRWDAVRPFSAIPFAMQSQFVPSYINANGTFGMVEAGEWKSYLPMPNFPEYPSATTAICYAHSEAMRRSLNSDGLKWAVDINQGTSKIEKGQTPRQNMTLSFYTWSEFEKNCGYSRLYGGVNFPDSVANIRDLAIRMGRRAVDFVRYHVNLARNPQENSSSGEKEEEDENSWKYYLRDRSHHQSRKKNGGSSNPKSLNYKYFVINP